MSTGKSKTEVAPYAKRGRYDPDKRIFTKTENNDETIGFNLSNRWHFDKGSVLIGGDFRRDMADVVDGNTYHYARNMYSLY